MKKRFYIWGSMAEQIRANAIEHARNLDPEKKWQITFEEKKDPRTNYQNRTLFGLKYPVLMEFMGLRGDDDRQALHEYFCGEYFGWKRVEIMGRVKQRPSRITTTNEHGERDVLPPDQFWDFVEFVDQRAAENGCPLPDPDPRMRG